jgi:hypothetical protein
MFGNTPTVDSTEYQDTLWTAFTESTTVELEDFTVECEDARDGLFDDVDNPVQMNVYHEDRGTGVFYAFDALEATVDDVCNVFDEAAAQLTA